MSRQTMVQPNLISSSGESDSDERALSDSDQNAHGLQPSLDMSSRATQISVSSLPCLDLSLINASQSTNDSLSSLQPPNSLIHPSSSLMEQYSLRKPPTGGKQSQSFFVPAGPTNQPARSRNQNINSLQSRGAVLQPANRKVQSQLSGLQSAFSMPSRQVQLASPRSELQTIRSQMQLAQMQSPPQIQHTNTQLQQMAVRINPMRSAIIPGHAISRSHPEDLLIQQPNRSYREPTVSQLLSENDVQMKLQHMHHELFQRSSVRSEVVYDDRLQLSGSIPVNHKSATQSVRPRLAPATRSLAAATRPVAVTARPVAAATRPAAQPHISQLPYPPGAFSDAQQPMDFQELNEAERTVMQSVEFEPQSQTVHRISNSLSFQRDKQRFSHPVSSRLQPSQPAPVSSGGKISISGFRPTQPTRQEPTSRTFIDLTQHVSMQSKETSPCSGMASSDPVALLHGSSRRQHVQPQAIVRDPLQPQHAVRDALQPSGFSMPQSTAPSRDPPTYRRSKSAPADMSPQKARMLRPRTHVRGHNVKCSSYTSKKAKKKMASSSTGTPTYSATGSKEQSEQVTVGEILQATDATDCIGDILKPLSLDESCSSTGRSLATQTDGIMTPGSVLSNGEAIICSQPLTALLASSQKKPKASTSRRKRQLSEECRGALLEGRKFSRITTNVISLSNPDHIKEIRCAK
eukprot:458763_1